ncbi:TetR/AcrR family transcriptional regulator [Stigmatella sp. ncwal1]|uniref:TetR/AcrR family transcriptional regulator n=1 Tax=Stigmatella ashevillensis TaxID=2995309 RepID=A0ABT5DDR7_9BACT|nr:TetR/AcrR family transcriptional regulator [Stigmatella ashevillena]MDC0711825.1 TetR/AcrR family transcriptional regulator [Stigmatella ashevillena]
MTQKPRAPDSALVWERPEPASRPTPGPLSRDRIVRAALALADAEGLASVSLRKVAAALDAGPMRLYGYLSTKEELLELMVDAVYGEMVSTEPIPSGWREALRSIAHRTRKAADEHTWLIDLLAGRHHLGPNALAHLEASLAALSDTPGFEDIDAVLQAVGTVNAYVIGALRNEASELRAERESGMTQSQWQEATWPYLQRMIATGRFPTLSRVIRDATHPSLDVVFDKGLDCVLDGIEARLKR